MYKNASYLQDLNADEVLDFKNKDQMLDIQKVRFIPESNVTFQFQK